jgi:hypothetical protein
MAFAPDAILPMATVRGVGVCRELTTGLKVHEATRSGVREIDKERSRFRSNAQYCAVSLAFICRCNFGLQF